MIDHIFIGDHLSFCFCDLFSKIYPKIKFTSKIGQFL